VSATRQLLDDVARWADGWLAYRQRTLGLPGLQFAIGHRGRVVRSAAHGVADLSTGERLTREHRFGIASHSKVFTATAVLRLAERSDPPLRLDDPVRRHLPDADVPADLRIEELLHHGGGISRDGVDGDYWQLALPFPGRQELAALLGRSPAPFPPNERFHYSNLGYGLLGRVIEEVTGTDYADHLHRTVMQPLELLNTQPDYDPRPGARYACGHSHPGGGQPRVPVEPAPTGALAPATGVMSTAGDLVRFFAAHCFGDDRLLSDAAKRRMQRRAWTTREGEHYGLGLQLLDVGERRWVGHAGGYPGQATKTWCDPKTGVVVAVLTNAVDGPAGELCTGIVRLLGHVTEGRPTSVPMHAPGCDPRRFTGRFANLWGSYDIAAFGERLLLVPAESNNPLDELGELVIRDMCAVQLHRTPTGYQSEGEPLLFDRDATGRVTRVRGPSGITGYPEEEYRRRFLAAGRVRPGAAGG
jgi:D-alanyl-D-alanine carboxypeptidase